MTRIHASTRSTNSSLDQRQQVSTAHPASATVRRKVRISPFWLHFVEMFAAMWIGMAAGVGIFLAITGLSSYSQGLRLAWPGSI